MAMISTLNAEALKSALTGLKNTRYRFRWLLAAEDAKFVLRCAFESIVERRGGKTVWTDRMEGMLDRVTNALIAEEPKSGLLLCGPCGNGKSTMMEAVKEATCYLRDRGEFRWINKDIFDVSLRIVDVRQVQNKALLATRDEAQLANWDGFKKISMMGIDDMGTEPTEVLYYGNPVNPMKELIEYRYTNQLYTMVTSNLNKSAFREKYGERVADRLNEMMEVVVIEEKSFRR